MGVKSNKQQIYLIANDVRSAHNVGSLMRTAEGLGIDRLYLTGYTPYPAMVTDRRLPHIAAKLSRQINKTALNAGLSLDWRQRADTLKLIKLLKKSGFLIVALEQTPESINIADYRPAGNIALIVGSEVEGIAAKLLAEADIKLQIPMAGQKESFNVAVAAAMALFYIKRIG